MGYPADTKNVVYLFGIYTFLTPLSAVFRVTFRAFVAEVGKAKGFMYEKKSVD